MLLNRQRSNWKGTEGSTEEVVSWKGKEGVGTENCQETAGAEQVEEYLESDTTDEWIRKCAGSKESFKATKRELDKVLKQQNSWDQAMKPSEKRAISEWQTDRSRQNREVFMSA